MQPLNNVTPIIDPEAIARFTEVVFGYLDHHVPVRLFSEKGTSQQSARNTFPPVASVGAHITGLATLAAKEQRGVFVVPGTVSQTRSARAEDIVQTGVVLIDLDTGDIPAKRAHLVHHLGLPTLEIASGGTTDAGHLRLHLYWRLSEAAQGEDLDLVSQLRTVIARQIGGDTSFDSLHQPIRVAGTIHGKYGHKTLVKIISDASTEHHLNDLAAMVQDLPPFPGIMMKIATEPRGAGNLTARDLRKMVIRADNQDEISRFDTLSKVIGHWLRNVRQCICTLDEAWTAVSEHNTAMINPPWEVARLRREFDALQRRDELNHGALPYSNVTTYSGVAPPPLSEDALAAGFVASNGSVWRHVAAWGAWFHWSGNRWARDEASAVSEVIRQVCRAAVKGHDKAHQARRVASEKTIRAVRGIAASDPAIAALTTAWDAFPMILNTPDGIVDLETGEVAPHDPDLLLTQITGALPGNGCDRWLAFLDEVTDGDLELQSYLARFCGYCLSGSTREQIFVFLHGSGANGKSVFLQTLADVLGDYAATATLDTFMAARNDRHLTELAGLRAARLVLVPETEAGRSWAEARIKAITGGEKVRANFMRQDHFEFLPQFKLAVAGNHRPTLSNVGEAMRRRLHLVPFTVTIPPERRDRDLLQKLSTERDGILGWMIAGCAEWQRIGLAPPKIVLEAAEAYFKDEDIFGHWVAECCELGESLKVTSQALFQSWSAWAQAAGHPIGNSKSLGEALSQRGLKAAKVARMRGWQGISLRHTVPAPGEEISA